MSSTSGTCEATAVTTRQWVGIKLAAVAVGAIFLLAFVFSIWLLTNVSRSGSTRSEVELFVLGWSYVWSPPAYGYAYPPISMWIGIILAGWATDQFTGASRTAIRAAKAGTRTRRQLLSSRSEARADRDAGKNLTRQLRERGYAGSLARGRVKVRLGLGLAGAGLVLVTALLAPTNVSTAGQTIQDAQKGLLPTVCLVASLIALAGLLLSFPYGPREKLVVDASGNVRGADEPVVSPSVPPLPRVSAHFCPRCGSPAPEAGRFCASCGTDLAGSPGSPAPGPAALAPVSPVQPLAALGMGQASQAMALVSRGQPPAAGVRSRLRPAGIASLIAFVVLVVAGGGFLALQHGRSILPSGPFSSTGSMATYRSGHAASLLPEGRVLVSGGQDGHDVSLASAELYDPKTGTFEPTSSMGAARHQHTATLLADGRVLVAGGATSENVALASAELYDPKTGTFEPTGSMATARQQHTATLLSDGRLLVAGGANSDGSTASAELYDPKTGRFAATGSLLEARDHHTATLLVDGRVLVAGGWNSHGAGAIGFAELYDPKTGAFSRSGSMDGRYFHTATLLSDGRVLISGGMVAAAPPALASAELFDPKTGLFNPTGSMAARRAAHTATLLRDGRVLLAGGNSSTSSWEVSAEVFDPSSGTFSLAGSMAKPRSVHTATLLPEGRVLLVGGSAVSAELFEPALATLAPSGSVSPANPGPSGDTYLGRFDPTGSLQVARSWHRATLLADGRVLVTGGDSAHVAAEVYDPATGAFSLTGSMKVARVGHAAALLSDGRVLVTGGGNATAEVYDPKTARFARTGSMKAVRSGHTATLLPDGRVLIVGGYDSHDAPVATAEVYDPKTATFARTGSMTTARARHTATLLADGRVLVAGGSNADTLALDSAEVYDPKAARFARTGSMTDKRSLHTATLLADGRVLVAGGFAHPRSDPLLDELNLGREEASSTGSAEVFDPRSGRFAAVGSMLSLALRVATLLPDGRVLVVGGKDKVAEVFDPKTDTFSQAGSLPVAREFSESGEDAMEWQGPTATLLPDGRVLVVGGVAANGSTLVSAEVFR